MSYTLIQAQSNAFCQHATSNRECLPDDAGQIRHFFFNFDEIITLSKLIHQNVFFGGKINTLIVDFNYRDCRRRRCVSATTSIPRFKENDSNTHRK